MAACAAQPSLPIHPPRPPGGSSRPHRTRQGAVLAAVLQVQPVLVKVAGLARLHAALEQAERLRGRLSQAALNHLWRESVPACCCCWMWCALPRPAIPAAQRAQAAAEARRSNARAHAANELPVGLLCAADAVLAGPGPTAFTCVSLGMLLQMPMLCERMRNLLLLLLWGALRQLCASCAPSPCMVSLDPRRASSLRALALEINCSYFTCAALPVRLSYPHTQGERPSVRIEA